MNPSTQLQEEALVSDPGIFIKGEGEMIFITVIGGCTILILPLNLLTHIISCSRSSLICGSSMAYHIPASDWLLKWNSFIKKIKLHGF
jgi:hypothetical protein